MKIHRTQINDWLESQVAEALLYAMEAERERLYEARAGAFQPGDPNKTHEIKSWLFGEERRVEDFIDLLKGDETTLGQYFIENDIDIVED